MTITNAAPPIDEARIEGFGAQRTARSPGRLWGCSPPG
jgi:hypothetical protein